MFPADENPAIELDETVLTQQANSLGMPVNTILESPDLSGVSPDGLVVPGGEAIGTSWRGEWEWSREDGGNPRGGAAGSCAGRGASVIRITVTLTLRDEFIGSY